MKIAFAVLGGLCLLLSDAASAAEPTAAQSRNVERCGELAARGRFIGRQGHSLLVTNGIGKQGPRRDGFCFDLADPAAPRLVCGELPNAWEIALLGDHALVVDYTPHFFVYDARQRPWREVAKLPMPAQTENVLVRDRLAYVANHTAGLTIVDVADPTRPHIVSNFNPKIDCDAVGLSGTCAILYAHWESRLVLVDVSDPRQPRQVGVYQHEPKTFNQGEIDVAQGFAYCTMDKGLAIVDVRSPAAPKLAATILPGVKTNDVTLADHYAFVAATSQGVRVFDMRQPAAPLEVGFYQSDKGIDAQQVAAYRPDSSSGDYYLYVANARGPVLVLRFRAPTKDR